MIIYKRFKVSANDCELPFYSLQNKKKHPPAVSFVNWYYHHKGIELLRIDPTSKSNPSLLKKYGVEVKAGIPDFCYELDGKIFFVESKSNRDILRQSQKLWMIENNNFSITIFTVRYYGKSKITDSWGNFSFYHYQEERNHLVVYVPGKVIILRNHEDCGETAIKL